MKAIKIDLFNFQTIPMRTFHMTWWSFFLCFFSWFGVAAFMPIIRDEFSLTKTQIGNILIASVAMTILARLIIGWVCDKIGARKAYTWLLIIGSIPVICIGFSYNYETFLLFRLMIGCIGASFVITQYHTSIMFASNCVGSANATTAGWGNMGGGATQIIMPLILSLFMSLGIGKFLGWRLSMVVPGVLLFITGILYLFITKDTAEGNTSEITNKKQKTKGVFINTIKDYRVWILFIIYGTCFGVELTINNIAALYYTDVFNLSLIQAGLVAGSFGLMNIFARTLGGNLSDKISFSKGLKGRMILLGALVLLEGLSLILFSQIGYLPLAIITMIIFSLFVQMTEGATFSVVPFINQQSLGSIAGVVGAGGNAGAIAFGFLLTLQDMSYSSAFLIIGIVVLSSSILTLFLRFSDETEKQIKHEIKRAQMQKLELE